MCGFFNTRRWFDLKRVRIEFDSVTDVPDIWIDGEQVAGKAVDNGANRASFYFVQEVGDQCDTKATNICRRIS